MKALVVLVSFAGIIFTLWIYTVYPGITLFLITPLVIASFWLLIVYRDIVVDKVKRWIGNIHFDGF